MRGDLYARGCVTLYSIHPQNEIKLSRNLYSIENLWERQEIHYENSEYDAINIL